MRHPTWCASGHRCGLGEHRSAPIVVQIPGAGSLVLTRVQSPNGTGHAEVRLNLTLPSNERDARLRLTALLTQLTALIGPGRALRRAS